MEEDAIIEDNTSTEDAIEEETSILFSDKS